MIPLPSYYDDIDPDFSTCWERIEYKSEATPQLYMGFAIQDFELDNSGRSRVNALSNAKRALHLQVETLANLFGFENYTTNKRFPNFHDHLEYCSKCGVIAPRILKKLNKVRNAVEHNYYIPNESETEDFIDVVELFLAATDKSIYRFPLDLEFRPAKVLLDEAPDIRMIETKPYSGKLVLKTYTENVGGEISLTPKDREYFIWLNLMLDGVHTGHLELNDCQTPK